MLLDRESESRIMRAIASIAGSFSVYMIGRDLGQNLASAASQAFGGLTQKLTFLEQSYVAGKIANQIGTDKLKKMTEKQLQNYIRTTNMSLTSADRVIMKQLRNDTERFLSGRSVTWQQNIKVAVSDADRAWRATLTGRTFNDAKSMSLARNSALRNLLDRLEDSSAGFQGDVNKIIQSEMNTYFQQGQVAEMVNTEIVYKIPRASACPHCMRIHINADGSPRKYRLEDVRGNSNYGLPASAWQFTIGPVHPYCYCILYRESDRNIGPNATLASARKETLGKALEVYALPSSCGEISPDTLFEDQLLKSAPSHKHDESDHRKVMTDLVREIYGDQDEKNKSNTT